jgi:hypothetical protein
MCCSTLHAKPHDLKMGRNNNSWTTALRHTTSRYNIHHCKMKIAILRHQPVGKIHRWNALNLTKMTCTPYYVQFKSLTDAYKRAHHPLNGHIAHHKRSMLDTFTTIQSQYRWYGTQKQNWSRHNFMSCLTTTFTPYKHLIPASPTLTQWTADSKQTAINKMILLEMNTPIYFLMGEWKYTQTT